MTTLPSSSLFCLRCGCRLKEWALEKGYSFCPACYYKSKLEEAKKQLDFIKAKVRNDKSSSEGSYRADLFDGAPLGTMFNIMSDYNMFGGVWAFPSDIGNLEEKSLIEFYSRDPFHVEYFKESVYIGFVFSMYHFIMETDREICSAVASMTDACLRRWAGWNTGGIV